MGPSQLDPELAALLSGGKQAMGAAVAVEMESR